FDELSLNSNSQPTEVLMSLYDSEFDSFDDDLVAPPPLDPPTPPPHALQYYYFNHSSDDVEFLSSHSSEE
ncbi:hypothetical protein KI387_008120, partial [Taxus chinensis]